MRRTSMDLHMAVLPILLTFEGATLAFCVEYAVVWGRKLENFEDADLKSQENICRENLERDPYQYQEMNQSSPTVRRVQKTRRTNT